MKSKSEFFLSAGSPDTTTSSGPTQEGMSVTEPQTRGCGRGNVFRLIAAMSDTTQLIAVYGGMDDAERDAFTSAVLSSCNVSVMLNTGADTPLN